MSDEQDLYLETRRHIPRRWLIVVVGLGAILLLGFGGLVAALGVKHFIPGGTPAETQTVPTLVPTFTPRPTTAPVATLSARPWSDDSGPVGMVEVALSLPAGARARGEVPPECVEGPSRTVGHQPPSGYRYWSGDLVQTRHGLAWTGTAAVELHWTLLREPGATWPSIFEVEVDDQVMRITLEPGSPAATSATLE